MQPTWHGCWHYWLVVLADTKECGLRAHWHPPSGEHGVERHSEAHLPLLAPDTSPPGLQAPTLHEAFHGATNACCQSCRALLLWVVCWPDHVIKSIIVFLAFSCCTTAWRSTVDELCPRKVLVHNIRLITFHEVLHTWHCRQFLKILVPFAGSPVFINQRIAGLAPSCCSSLAFA